MRHPEYEADELLFEDLESTEQDNHFAPDSSIGIVKEQAKQFFRGARGSHDWEHTLRVCRLSQRIGIAENADMGVLLSAAFLHDIGRSFQDDSNGAVCHAKKGAELAESIVNTLDLSSTQKKNIIHCVRSHRFRESSIPETIEAKVLFDADKLDAIGAVGIARAYLFAGELGARLHSSIANIKDTQSYSKDDTGYREYQVKLRKIKQRIMTQKGRKIAEDRHNFMEQFFYRFLEEYAGKL